MDSSPESEQRLRAIVDTAVDAIITIDQRGIIESVNPSTERMFGYTRRELIGRNVNILMPSPHAQEHDDHLRRYLATGKARIIGIGRDVVGRRKDGRHVPIHLSVSEVRLERRLLFTAIMHDISERRRLEKEVLEASAKEQRRIGRELHDGVCQDLVGAALGISVLARRLATDSPAAAADAEKIAEIIRRTATQVRNLSHGLAPLDISTEGLNSALQKLAHQVSDTAAVRCTFAGDNCFTSCEPMSANHLYRIVQEAVNNAIRHGKATDVRVQLASHGGHCVLTIEDNGRGFARKIGQGLGLQTMAYRARVIGGTLSIEPSGGGGGTTVRCLFHSNHSTEAGNGNGEAKTRDNADRPSSCA